MTTFPTSDMTFHGTRGSTDDDSHPAGYSSTLRRVGRLPSLPSQQSDVAVHLMRSSHHTTYKSGAGIQRLCDQTGVPPETLVTSRCECSNYLDQARCRPCSPGSPDRWDGRTRPGCG